MPHVASFLPDQKSTNLTPNFDPIQGVWVLAEGQDGEDNNELGVVQNA